MRVSVIGGRLIDPDGAVDETTDVHVADGHIVAIGHRPDGFEADRTLDARGLVVCPGLIDICARLREPGLEHKATIASESKAAVANGITTLCMPPDTLPVVDTPAVVELIHQRAANTAKARVEVVGALTQGLNGEQLAEMGALAEAGCVGVGNAGEPVPNSAIMRRAMEYAATFDLSVFSRPQDSWLCADGDMHEGAISTRLGLSGVPAISETIGLARDLLLAEQTGARTHFLHLSSARSVSMVAEARSRGLAVTASVTAHHLHLTEAELMGFNSECHLDPPLRQPEDRQALRRGLADGTLQVVCSDHQPHERDARLNPFSATDPGLSGLDTLLGLVLRLVDEKALTLSQALGALTCEPARVLGLGRGRLAVGSVADVCVFDPECRWRLEPATMASQGENSPFIGETFSGKTRFTLVDGRIVYADGE